MRKTDLNERHSRLKPNQHHMRKTSRAKFLRVFAVRRMEREVY